MEIVDATCPYVKKIHRIVEKQSAEGRKVLIIGSEDHPEVQGIKGWGDERTVFIEDMDDFLKLQLPEMRSFVLYPRRHLITRNFKI